MYSNKNTYSKKEKLCSPEVISLLFENGYSFHSEPFRIVWMQNVDQQPFPALSAISVGKKSIKRAVDRNRTKRRIREAWRIKKAILYKQLADLDMQILLMIIYTGKRVPDYSYIEEKTQVLLNNFSLHLKEFSGRKKEE
ncbi:MAG: ribonuclease P protein component [Bacteroidales bacterium]|nr:ribonuclease P protein component [Bacteroidales bacterium]